MLLNIHTAFKNQFLRMKDNKGLIALAVILGLALIGALIWGFNRSSKVDTLTTENYETNESLEAMTELRDKLAGEVDSLAVAYGDLANINNELEGTLANTQGELNNAQSALDQAKRNRAAEVNDLRSQIEALLEARSGLETSITALQSENDSLRTHAGVLEMDLAQSRDQNDALNKLNETMQGEVDRLTLANFKASAFQVDLTQRRGEKVTAKSSRARNITVSFDLANVPEEYQGVRPVYLVITDETGTPINTVNATKATVRLNDKSQEILAAEAKEVNIGQSQRLSFNHELEDKLKAGYYRVLVYTNVGMLGTSSFQLR